MKDELIKQIEYAYLGAIATDDTMIHLCDQAKRKRISTVVVNTAWVRFCKNLLKDTDIQVCAAISYPLGQSGLETKISECKQAIIYKADEIAYVIDCGRLLMEDYSYIEKEMAFLTKTCHDANKKITVILESTYFNTKQLEMLKSILNRIKPDFIQTSIENGNPNEIQEIYRSSLF